MAHDVEMTDGRTVKYLRVTETAKLLRAALKASFPGTKFSVRSSSYSGGASIDVVYTDGPKQKDVDAVAQRFAGADFDGMQDLKTYHTSLLANPDGSVEEVHHGADFVFVRRRVSPERDARIRATIERGTRVVPFSFDAQMPEGWYADDAGVMIPGHALAYGRWGRDFYNALRELID